MRATVNVFPAPGSPWTGRTELSNARAANDDRQQRWSHRPNLDARTGEAGEGFDNQRHAAARSDGGQEAGRAVVHAAARSDGGQEAGRAVVHAYRLAPPATLTGGTEDEVPPK
jgi:hypothetical protein